jgi:hypothetical protein
MFFGLFSGLPDPDLLVRDMDPGPVSNTDSSTNRLSWSKNSTKNLDTYCYMTFFGDLVFKKWFKCTNLIHYSESWIRVSGSGSKPKYMDAENFVLIGKKSVFRIRIRIDPHRFIVPYPLFYFTNFMFFL